MNYSNPVFIYMLLFYITRPRIRKYLREIETEVKGWPDVEAGTHPMGGRKFVHDGREFGHIHWNGDLDILFNPNLVEELIAQGLAGAHRFVPGKAITYKLNTAQHIPRAINLLKLSYLCKSLKAGMGVKTTIKKEIAQLPFNETVINLADNI